METKKNTIEAKYIKVERLRFKINEMLAGPIQKEEKEVLCSVLEYLLMEEGNYRGYDLINGSRHYN